MAQVKHNITAIIYDSKGNILSIGKNDYKKSHPIQAKMAEECGEHHKIFLHAEIDAIIKCKKLDKAYRIFVSRVNSGGKYRLAKPCRICSHAIKEMTPIKIIEHT